MMRVFLFVFISFFGFFALAQSQNSQNFYVGTFTDKGAEGIYLCGLDTITGDIQLEQTFKAVDDPSFLRLSPDKNFLYVVTRATPEVEPSGGFVNAYRVATNGDLEFINKQVSHGAGTCHVDVSPDGEFVAIATYAGGTTSIFPVDETGGLKKALVVIKNNGSGPDEDRQKEPHAHSVKFSKTEPTIFSADLGTDQLNIYHFENGSIGNYAQDFVELPSGSGPRHFDFHSSGNKIYVINELNSTISALIKKEGKWSVFQNISTLPAEFKGHSFCADIHLSKNGKYLYGSNRGHNSIAVFEVNEKGGSLEMLGTVPVEGDWPRNFGIAPGGKWMLVANQKSNNITVFRLNEKNGIPEFTGKELKLPAPVCIEFL